MSGPRTRSAPAGARFAVDSATATASPVLGIMVCVAVVICGAAVMVLELIGTRVLAPIFGNSLYVWTALIAVALVSLTFGYPLGGSIADRSPQPRTFFTLIGVAGVLVLGTLLLRGPVLAAAADWGPRGGTLGAALILFTPPLLLLGTVFPFAVRLLAREVAHIGMTVGTLSALSAAGSIVGTIATGFVLIPIVGIRNILLGVAGALLLAAVVGLLVCRAPRAAALGTLAVLVVGVLVAASDAAVRPSSSEMRLLLDVNSAYGDIKVVEYRTSGARVMFLGQVMQTVEVPDDEYSDVYDLVNYIPLLRPAARRVLLIGLGGGHMVKLLNARGVAVDAVEIDPAVIAAARQFFGITESPLSHVIEQDGRAVLSRCERQYDAVIVNAFAGGDIPPHLTSHEAFAAMKRCLVPGGVLMMNCMNAAGDPGGGVLGDLLATLRAEALFRQVRTFAWGAEDAGELASYIVFASDGGLDVDAARNERAIPAPVLSRIAATAHEVTIPGGRGSVITDDLNPVDLRQLPNNDIQRRGTLSGPFRDLFVPH